MLLKRLIGAAGSTARFSEVDDETAVRTLLSENGAFARGLKPVALMRGDGAVSSANDSFFQFVELCNDAETLNLLVRDAVASGTPQRGTIVLNKPIIDDDKSASFEKYYLVLHVLPLPGGKNVLVQAYDVTHDRTLRAALVESRQRYKDLVESSSDFVWETSVSGNFIFVSPGGALGYSADELVDHYPSEFILSNPSDSNTVPFHAREPVTDVDVWFRRADGKDALLIASATPVFDNDGGWIGARGVCRDATVERESNNALAAAQTREKLLAYVTRSIHDEIDPSNMLNAAAAATAKAMSAEQCKIFQMTPSDTCVLIAEYGAPPPSGSAEKNLLEQAARDGEPIMGIDTDRHLLFSAPNFRQRVNGAISVSRNLSNGGWTPDDVILVQEIATQVAIAIEQAEYHARLEKLSRTDELTGLLNRRAFFDELELRIGGDRVTASPGALFFVDLDNFKQVNDIYGHHRGDEALIRISSILTENSRPGDLVSRFGGDEFALWFDRTDEASAVLRAVELLGTASGLEEFTRDESLKLSFSVGIAVWKPDTGETQAELTVRADDAMYEMKKTSKGGYILASPYDPNSQESSA